MMQQLALFDLENKLSDRSHLAVGAMGERWAYNALERSGYTVATVGHEHRRGDLLAIDPATGEQWAVEVKAARRDKNGMYQWNLVKNDQHGHTDVNDADVVLLLAVEASGYPVLFVIPTSALGELKTIKINSNPRTYAGRWARYRQTRTIKLATTNKEN